jgi:excisionase family DNA binding protein
MDKLVLRPAEVADVIGLSRSRVYQLIASGEIPSFCIGGMRRVAVEQLREWVAQKQREVPRRLESAAAERSVYSDLRRRGRSHAEATDAIDAQ